MKIKNKPIFYIFVMLLFVGLFYYNDYNTLNSFGNSEKVKEITIDTVKYDFCSKVSEQELSKIVHENYVKIQIEKYCDMSVLDTFKGKYYYAFFKQDIMVYPVLFGNGKYNNLYFIELEKLDKQLNFAIFLEKVHIDNPFAEFISFFWKAMLALLLLFVVAKELILGVFLKK